MKLKFTDAGFNDGTAYNFGTGDENSLNAWLADHNYAVAKGKTSLPARDSYDTPRILARGGVIDLHTTHCGGYEYSVSLDDSQPVTDTFEGVDDINGNVAESVEEYTSAV